MAGGVTTLSQTLKNFFKLAETGQRIEGLDTMRAIGYLMVLTGHAFYFFKTSVPALFNLFFIFQDGIELFFSLSGFLIGIMLLRGFSGAGFGKYQLRNFLLRRWFKTLPSYYLVIGIHVLLGLMGVSILLKDFSWRFFFFVQNICVADFYFFPISYSLAIEEWFYLLLPLLLMVSVRIWPSQPVLRIVAVNACLIIGLCSLYRLYLVQYTDAHFDAVIRKSILSRLDAPLYGVLMACLYQYRPGWFSAQALRLFILAVVMYLPLLILRKLYAEHWMLQAVYFNLSPLVYALMLPFFMQLQVPVKWIRHLCRYLSLSSYSFYLVHLTPVSFTLLYVYEPVTVWQSSAVFILYLLIVFPATHVLYKYFEKPVMDRRKKLEQDT